MRLTAQQGAGGISEDEGAVAFVVGGDETGGKKLAKEAAPARGDVFGADAEDGEAVVAVLFNAWVGFAFEDIDDVGDTEAFAGALDGG